MDSKPWWESKGLWGAIVASVCGLLGLGGHLIDAGTQEVLVNNILAIINGVVTIAGIVAAVGRLTAKTTLTKGK